MSAEMESGKEEENIKEKEKKTIKYFVNKLWQIGIKILQLIICGTCIGLIYEPAQTTGLGKSHMHHVGIMYTAYSGYILINIIFLWSKIIGDKIPYKTAALFSINGAGIFLITAILLAVDRSHLIKHYFFQPTWYQLHMMTSAIIFSFINVGLFVIDAIFTFKRQQDF